MKGKEAYRSQPLTSLLTETETASLRALAKPVRVVPPQTLYHEGDPCRHAYIMEDGLLMLERLASDGRRQVLAFVYPGDFMGIDMAGKHMVSAVAIEPCRLSQVRLSDLNDLARRHPAIDTALKRVTHGILGFMLDQVCVLGRMTARQRMAFFFLHMADRQKCTGDSPEITLAMTRADIANFLGLRIETAIRTLSAMKRDGLIDSVSLNVMRIRDMDTLVDLTDLSAHAWRNADP